MRVCLLTGGGYPFRRDALGGWCRTLVDGLSEHRFDLVTVCDRELPRTPAYRLPGHVASARGFTLPRENRAFALARETKAFALARDTRALARDTKALARDSRANQEGAEQGGTSLQAAAMLCAGLAHQNDEAFTRGLTALAGRPDPLPATAPLADLLLAAWRAARETSAGDRLPRLSPRDARTAVTLLRHAARALAVPLPKVDLVHCVGGTTPLLTALAGRWRTGTPLLLTEARAPMPRLRASEERLSPAVRAVLSRFRRAVARTGYAEAGLIAPLSEYHPAWALRHGAEPGRLVPVPAGVDPAEFPAAPEHRDPPAIVWAGTGGPDSGLPALLTAFARMRTAAPDVVLHLVGIVAAHEEYAAGLVERSGLGRAVRLHPLPADPHHRYAAGHVVVHVPGPADPPYRLIEAMMSGRAVVGVDVGPVAETLGDAGVVVPENDPEALAAACVALLEAPARRRALGDAARRRALACFTTDRVVGAYGALYTDLAGPPPAPSYELALAVPAPRTIQPATVRWLTAESHHHRRTP
jgi:glycosyltransferase involved in cell wall biosynthesis